MKIEINIEKKHLIIFSVFLVILMAGFGMATGYTAGEPFHITLFADKIRGQSGDTVIVDDNLDVTGSLTVAGTDVSDLVTSGSSSGYTLSYESNTISPSSVDKSGAYSEIRGGHVTCPANSYLYKVSIAREGGNVNKLSGFCRKIDISLLSEGQCTGTGINTAQCGEKGVCQGGTCYTKQCTQDSHCSGDTPICSMTSYTCVAKPECTSSSDCNYNEICAIDYGSDMESKVCLVPGNDYSKCNENCNYDYNNNYVCTYSCDYGENKEFLGGYESESACYCVYDMGI